MAKTVKTPGTRKNTKSSKTVKGAKITRSVKTNKRSNGKNGKNGSSGKKELKITSSPGTQAHGAWDCKNSGKIKENEKILMEITEHPLTRKPLLTIMGVALIVFLSWSSYFFINHFLTPVFVFLFLIISNTSFFMPSRYVFTEEKMVIDRIIYRRSLAWTRFKSYVLDKNGVYLSTLSDAERFDRFRGVFLVMNKENRGKVKPLLEEKISGSDRCGTC
jgi:hypothetical protein